MLFLLVSLLPVPTVHAQSTEANLKAAFIGDQGAGSNADAVLNLIKNEGAHLVIHSGDFDYTHNPTAWDAKISGILGDSFPYFASAGNHDVQEWTGYQQKLQTRLPKITGATCTGTLGTKSHCTYRGLSFILSSIGSISGGGDAAYISQEFANDTATWKVCDWHKTQSTMQLGAKGDEVGWQVFNACTQAGAIIATAHEHSYQRTKTLKGDISTHTVDATCSDSNATPNADVCVGSGRTFVFVSGMAGKDQRNQDRCLGTSVSNTCNVSSPADCQQWAACNTTNQNNGTQKFGALFIIFNYQGNPNKAHGYFKLTDGSIKDEFDITKDGTSGGGNPTPSVTATVTPGGANPTPTRTPTPGSPSATPVPTTAAQPSTTPYPTPSGNCSSSAIGTNDCFLYWVSEFSSATIFKGDFDQDGTVRLTDFELWRRAYQAQPQTPTATAAPGAPSRTPTPTGSGPSATPVPTVAGGAITASVETDPVTTSGDSADDPAIWIHPSDPSQSLIIGTNKNGPLEVYDLSGNKTQTIGGSTGNVDIRYNFPLDGNTVALVTAFSKSSNGLVAYRVDAAQKKLVDVTDTGHANVGGGGTAMYHSPVSGKFYYFSNGGATLRQYELTETTSGKVGATLVRTANYGTTGKSESVAADDILKQVYVSEETVGIWKLGAEPGDGSAKTQVDKTTGQGGHVTPDSEGLAIYYKPDGTGYLIHSNQGANNYNVYRREGSNSYIGTFTIADGTVDGTSSTDGLEVTNVNLGTDFPGGLLAVQDGSNKPSGNQNFKLVDWRKIAAKFNLAVDTSWDPRTVGQ